MTTDNGDNDLAMLLDDDDPSIPPDVDIALVGALMREAQQYSLEGRFNFEAYDFFLARAKRIPNIRAYTLDDIEADLRDLVR